MGIAYNKSSISRIHLSTQSSSVLCAWEASGLVWLGLKFKIGRQLRVEHLLSVSHHIPIDNSCINFAAHAYIGGGTASSF